MIRLQRGFGLLKKGTKSSSFVRKLTEFNKIHYLYPLVVPLFKNFKSKPNQTLPLNKIQDFKQ